MPRGRIWAYYSSDDGATYAIQTDADYFDAPERGWVGPAAAATPVYPRGWRPRFVFGVDEVGNVRRAICATTSCDLWTGTAASFEVTGTDALQHTCSVIGRVSERFSSKPA